MNTKTEEKCMTAKITAFPKLSITPWFKSSIEELRAGVEYACVCHNVEDVIECGCVPSTDPHEGAIAEIAAKHPGWTLVY